MCSTGYVFGPRYLNLLKDVGLLGFDQFPSSDGLNYRTPTCKNGVLSGNQEYRKVRTNKDEMEPDCPYLQLQYLLDRQKTFASDLVRAYSPF